MSGGYNSFWIDRGSGAFKIDDKWRTSIITDPKDGRRPELTPAAKKRAAFRAKRSRKNIGEAWWIKEGIEPGPYDDPELRPLAERCLLGFGSTGGPPMLPVLYNNLKRIVQTEDHIMILVEMVHDARIIRMNAEHAPSDVRSWLGDSVGRWEGDTLVIDTTNFSDRPALFRGLQEPARRRALRAHRPRHPAVQLHGRGSDRMDRSVERRVHLARDGHQGVRIRLPRGELLVRRDPSRCANPGGGGSREVRRRLGAVPCEIRSNDP